MSGPGPGPGPDDRFHSQRDAPYALPTRAPHRRPGAAAVDPADVSSPELGYHVQPARGNSSRPGQHRQSTMNSGGKYTVSPASSIHEDDEEAYGYGEPAGLSPSPPHRHQDAAPGQAQISRSRDGPTEAWLGHGHQPHAAGIAMTSYNNSNTGTQLPSLWPTHPPNDDDDDDGIPYPAQQHWRGSRDLQALTEARAREAESGHGPIRTSYGPAPAPVRVTSSSAAAVPVHTATSEPTPAPPSPPPPLAPPSTQWHPSQSPSQSPGPFMHYEDIAYLTPTPASPGSGPTSEQQQFPPPPESPKDEAQIDAGLPRADTFPEEMMMHNRPRARRSWDRQRQRQRRRQVASSSQAGEVGSREGLGRGRGQGLGAVRSWLPEILCCVVGVAGLVGVVVVLKVFEGRAVRDWPLGVSINTVVAFVVAVCQVVLAVPLGEGLAQLKWNSFARGARPLGDFEAFEDARRGPVGSARLLWKRKGRYVWMSGLFCLFDCCGCCFVGSVLGADRSVIGHSAWRPRQDC